MFINRSAVISVGDAEDYFNRIDLDANQENDIWNMYNNTLLMQVTLKLVQENYLSKNLTVKLGQSGTNGEMLLTPNVISSSDIKRWNTFLKELDKMLYLYGFCPIKFEKVELSGVANYQHQEIQKLLRDDDTIKKKKKKRKKNLYIDSAENARIRKRQKINLNPFYGSSLTVDHDDDIYHVEEDESDESSYEEEEVEKEDKIYKYFPFVPLRKTGKTVAWLDENMKLNLGWVNAPFINKHVPGSIEKIDPDVLYHIAEMPTIEGLYTSRAATLLNQWRDKEFAIKTQAALGMCQVAPQYATEFKPPSTTGTALGEASLTNITAEQEQLRANFITSQASAANSYIEKRYGNVVGTSENFNNFITTVNGVLSNPEIPNNVAKSFTRYMGEPFSDNCNQDKSALASFVKKPLLNEIKLGAYETLNMFKQDTTIPYFEIRLQMFNESVLFSLMPSIDLLSKTKSARTYGSSNEELKRNEAHMKRQFKNTKAEYEEMLKSLVLFGYKDIFKLRKLKILLQYCETGIEMLDAVPNIDNFLNCVNVTINIEEESKNIELLEKVYSMRIIDTDTFGKAMASAAGIDEKDINYLPSGEFPPETYNVIEKLMFPATLKDMEKVKNIGATSKDGNNNVGTNKNKKQTQEKKNTTATTKKKKKE